MSQEKMREEFEAAYQRGDFMCIEGPFDNPRKNQAWTIWQASRAAAVVYIDKQSPQLRSIVVSAIEEAGIRCEVKP